jgi:hypothetical protein
MPIVKKSDACMRSILSVAVVIMVSALMSGCGVGYTLLKSEAKLDRLAVPMTKAQVLDQIGHPDRVLKDDGRVLIWEYSLTTRNQWWHELSYCPVSILVGGCLFYPITNVLSDQRQQPQHVVLIDNELCAWGVPTAIVKRRRACVAAGAPPGGGGSWARPEPVVSGKGPIDRHMIDRYRTMAVMLFDGYCHHPDAGPRCAHG